MERRRVVVFKEKRDAESVPEAGREAGRRLYLSEGDKRAKNVIRL